VADDARALAGEGWLLLGADMDAVRVGTLAGGSVVAFTRGAPFKEPGDNEDGALVLPCGPDAAVLAVADGVGGHAVGDRASREALEAIADATRAAREAGRPVRDAILDGFEDANRRVLALPGDAATTLVVAELVRPGVRVYHAGDSVALVTGQRGRVKHFTTPHSPVGYAVEAGVLDARAAMSHAERHVVSNAIGASGMHIEVGPTVPLAPRDTLLVASDGLFDNLTPDQIVQGIRKGPLPDGASRLVERARARMERTGPDGSGKPDDLTVLVWRGL